MDVLKNAVEYGIIGLLIALSVWSVAVAVERWLYYRRVDLSQFSDAQTFEMALTKSWSSSVRLPPMPPILDYWALFWEL